MAKEKIELENPIRFARSPAKHGSGDSDYVFKIPRFLMQLGHIDSEKTYNIYLEEITEVNKNKIP